jgi:ectoine utilization protein EutC
MWIFREEEIRRVIGLDGDAIAAVEDGFARLAEDKVTMPPILRVDIPEHEGEVDVKTAVIQGESLFAIKISSGFFANARLGLPAGNGMMILVNAVNGRMEAVLMDNGYLTDVRTGAAGAVAARYLAKQETDTVTVIGAGTQARFQVKALAQVRNVKRLRVAGRDFSRVERFVRAMEQELDIPVTAAVNAEEAVRGSDVVITCTPAPHPVIKTDWLEPGVHVTAMGSDAEHKQELEAQVYQRADIWVCDSVDQCARLGELRSVQEAGLLAENAHVPALGNLVLGRENGRVREEQITVCDLTGTGVQDTAIALLAYRRLREAGAGIQMQGDIQ